jgi:serine/threonine protein phosphatase PrpC
MRIREGDLLLLATDGVFDNLFSEEILAVVKNFTARN